MLRCVVIFSLAGLLSAQAQSLVTRTGVFPETYVTEPKVALIYEGDFQRWEQLSLQQESDAAKKFMAQRIADGVTITFEPDDALVPVRLGRDGFSACYRSRVRGVCGWMHAEPEPTASR